MLMNVQAPTHVISTLCAATLKDRITVSVQVDIRAMANTAQVNIYPVANMSDASLGTIIFP